MVDFAARIITQWTVIQKYFNSGLSEDQKKNDSYRAIKQLLDNPRTYVQMQFIIDVAPILNQFLKQFQRADPLIHLLYHEVNCLVRRLLLRFVKTDIVGTKMGNDLALIDLSDATNLRDVEDMEIGEATKCSIQKLKAEQHRKLYLDMRKFFVTCTQYLMKNLPVANNVLHDAQCLHPAGRLLVCKFIRHVP